MGTAIEHTVPDRLSRHLTPGLSGGQPWVSECPDVKNYKWPFNLVWNRMLYSCTHMVTMGVKGVDSSSVYTADTQLTG